MNSRKAVDIVVRSMPVHGGGGMETATRNLAEGLVAAGWTVRVLTTSFSRATGALPYELVGITDSKPAAYSEVFFKGVRKLLDSPERLRDPVIFVSAAGWDYLRHPRKRRSVLVCHGTSKDEIRSKLKALTIRSAVGIARQTLWLRRDRIMYLAADVVCCVNDSITAQVRAVVGEGRAGKVVTIYNGVVPPVAAGGFKRQAGVLVACGRLVAEKGVHRLIESLPKVAAAVPVKELVVCGDGPEKGRLEKMASELSIPVRFTGHVSDVLQYLGGSEVLVLPSLRVEGLPMSVLEALSCGTKVVVPDSLKIPECQRSGVYYFSYDRGRGLEGAITDALSAVESVALSHELNLDRMIEAYDRVLPGPGAEPGASG